MNEEAMVSTLPDADMQAPPKALLRAAQRARDMARQTHTPLVLVRDGVLVEEFVADAEPLASKQKPAENTWFTKTAAKSTRS
jgi:hypothetical protein